MSEEWKRKLKDYYAGNLSDDEAAEIEQELERYEAYQEVIAEEFESQEETTQAEALPPEKANKIIKNSIRNARFSLTAYVIMIILMIYPFMTVCSYLYYSWNHKAEDFIQVAIQTVYVTEPNMSLEEMEIEREFGLFSFNVYMDLYKRVGKNDIKLGDWEVEYRFNEAQFPKRNYVIENPPKEIPTFDTKNLYHPQAQITNPDFNAWETLEKLPEGTVAEVYVSLEEVMEPENLQRILEGTNLEWRWYAIDTGLEASGVGLEGGYITPLGYPAQPDPDGWSPFNEREPNDEQFMDSLYFLQKYEQQAIDIAHAKWLDLDERINFLEENGLKSYGGVITGPTKEILKLKSNQDIRNINMGEVRLWNW
ncbi:anti-sigma factor [Bacillus sp. AK128]